MNRIDQTFAALREGGRAALMPYLPLGFPTPELALDLVFGVAEAGADLIELGVPFSDPLADGPVIQRATHIALKQGMTLARCLDVVREARQAGISIPLILMTYYNPVLRFGPEACGRAAREAGADGFIVPDLPPEESGRLAAACRENDLDLVFLAAPTSTPARLARIAAANQGFIYLVSVTGVTGVRDRVSAGLGGLLAHLRTITHKPVCVGFGIARAESARAVARQADGVIIGSALVSRIGDSDDPVRAARDFVAELRAAIS